MISETMGYGPLDACLNRLGNRASDELRRRPLVLSRQFAVTFDHADNPILYDFKAPEQHWRLSEVDRFVLTCFSPKKPRTAAAAERRLRRCFGDCAGGASGDEVVSIVDRFVKAGVLVREEPIATLYDEQMVESYAIARPVPAAVCLVMSAEARINPGTRVLDIGTGTGSVALQLADYSNHVTGLDVSEPFLRRAVKMARYQDKRVTFLREDANRLVFRDDRYDVITASQVLHRLEPQLAVRGMCHVLEKDGALFVVESKAVLHEEHPFRKFLGYGRKNHEGILRECNSHARRQSEIFDRLRPTNSRLDLTGAWIFRERRRFDITFARSYFFEEQLQTSALGPSGPWSRLMQLLTEQPFWVINGDAYWLLLRFDKVEDHGKAQRLQPVTTEEIIDISQSTTT